MAGENTIGHVDVIQFKYHIRPNKHRIHLKKIESWKNVKESVLISIHRYLFL